MCYTLHLKRGMNRNQLSLMWHKTSKKIPYLSLFVWSESRTWKLLTRLFSDEARKSLSVGQVGMLSAVIRKRQRKSPQTTREAMPVCNTAGGESKHTPHTYTHLHNPFLLWSLSFKARPGLQATRERDEDMFMCPSHSSFHRLDTREKLIWAWGTFFPNTHTHVGEKQWGGKSFITVSTSLASIALKGFKQ